MKTFITEQQIELLNEAYKSTLGTPNYTKYSCDWWLKSRKTSEWKFSIWGSPCPFKKGYFKTIRGVTYIYSEDGTERIGLSKSCKELLGIA